MGNSCQSDCRSTEKAADGPILRLSSKSAVFPPSLTDLLQKDSADQTGCVEITCTNKRMTPKFFVSTKEKQLITSENNNMITQYLQTPYPSGQIKTSTDVETNKNSPSNYPEVCQPSQDSFRSFDHRFSSKLPRTKNFRTNIGVAEDSSESSIVGQGLIFPDKVDGYCSQDCHFKKHLYIDICSCCSSELNEAEEMLFRQNFQDLLPMAEVRQR